MFAERMLRESVQVTGTFPLPLGKTHPSSTRNGLLWKFTPHKPVTSLLETHGLILTGRTGPQFARVRVRALHSAVAQTAKTHSSTLPEALSAVIFRSGCLPGMLRPRREMCPDSQPFLSYCLLCSQVARLEYVLRWEGATLD
jgi:hypothetical protein